MISFTKPLFFANTSFLSCFNLILISSSDISVRGNAFTLQRKSWIIFSPSWNWGRRKRKQKMFRLQAGFFQIPQRYKVLFITRNFLQAKNMVIFALAIMFLTPEQSSYTGIRRSFSFQPMSKKHQLISRNTIFNIKSSRMCSTLNFSVQSH